MSVDYSPPPDGVGIDVVESSDERLVISIPSGGRKARGIGWFALIWLATTVPMGIAYFVLDDGVWEGGEAPPMMLAIPFLTIIGAVGLGMLFIWLKMTYTQVFLAVTRDQFAIQKTLLGRRTLKKLPLDGNSFAELTESYSENHRPVYTVQMNAVDDQSTFATGLSYEEKHWIAATVNRFLGHESETAASGFGATVPEFCGECGAQLVIGDDTRVCPACGQIYDVGGRQPAATGAGIAPVGTGRDRSMAAAVDPRGRHVQITERSPALDPYDLPGGSRISIDFDDGSALAFSYPLKLPAIIRFTLGPFLALFSLIWYCFVGMFIFEALTGDEPLGMKIGITAFASLFLLAGLMPLGVLLALFLGRVRVQMDRERLVGSIGFLFFRRKKQVSMASVTDVGIGKAEMTSRSGRHRLRSANTVNLPLGGGNYTSAILKSSEADLPLTISSDRQFNEQVAGLLRFQLERAGVPLNHESC